MTRGVVYPIGAYLTWGSLPIYWKALRQVSALEILNNRVVWEMHSIIGEGRTWLDTFIVRSPSPTAARGTALRAACVLAVYQGEYETARTHCEEALSIFQQLGDKRGIATSLNELGLVALYQGEYAAGRQFLEQSLAIKRELGDDWLIANSLVNLGHVAGYENDYAAAYPLHQESLAIYHALNESSGMAIASSNLGHTALHLGRLDEARARQAESLKWYDAVVEARRSPGVPGVP